jgi:hypothetical protein
MATAIDPAGKARLLAHMNKEHQADLSYILQHYNGLTAAAAASPEMVDMDLATVMAQTPDGTTHVIALSPPMQSWDERRQRLIDMTLTARAALGVPAPEHSEGVSGSGSGHSHDTKSNNSPVTITTYIPPRPQDWAVFAAVAFYYSCYAGVRAGFFAPGTPGWQFVESIPYPGGAAGFTWTVDTIIIPVLGIHLTEAFLFDRTRLAKHGMPRGSLAWFLWMGSVMFEGYPAFRRFDLAVEKMKVKAK